MLYSKGLFLPFYIITKDLIMYKITKVFRLEVLFITLIFLHTFDAEEEEILFKRDFRSNPGYNQRFKNFRKSCLSKI